MTPENSKNSQEHSLKIALSFSGGGYRAAGFSLGVLTLLDSIEYDNTSLLEQIHVLSSVSGGSITGARYAIGKKRGETLGTVYSSIYKFLIETKIIDEALDVLNNKEIWKGKKARNFINSISHVYNEKLFKNAHFGELLVVENPIHLKYLYFNTTEFSTGHSFRFNYIEQNTAPESDEKDLTSIGSSNFRIPKDAANEIRLADIIATSLCFPGGFEPMNFPVDFIYPDSYKMLELQSRTKQQVGIMDGGVIDNQGIESVLSAEKLMKRKLYGQGNSDDKESVIDLIIVSDVDIPYTEEYVAVNNITPNWWRSLSLKCTILLISLSVLIFGFLLMNNLFPNKIGLVIISTFFSTMAIAITIAAIFSNRFFDLINFPKNFKKPISKLLKVKLGTYSNLLINRISSVRKMNYGIFTNQISRLLMQKIRENPAWTNRRIENAIYDLKQESVKTKDAGNLDYLMPSIQIQEVAKKASSMKTTIWFSNEDLVENRIKDLIACGQFTLCWNLLRHLDKIQKDDSNTNPRILKLLENREQLMQYWDQFKENPYWMVNDWNVKLGINYTFEKKKKSKR